MIRLTFLEVNEHIEANLPPDPMKNLIKRPISTGNGTMTAAHPWYSGVSIRKNIKGQSKEKNTEPKKSQPEGEQTRDDTQLRGGTSSYVVRIMN